MRTLLILSILCGICLVGCAQKSNGPEAIKPGDYTGQPGGAGKMPGRPGGTGAPATKP